MTAASQTQTGDVLLSGVSGHQQEVEDGQGEGETGQVQEGEQGEAEEENISAETKGGGLTMASIKHQV